MPRPPPAHACRRRRRSLLLAAAAARLLPPPTLLIVPAVKLLLFPCAPHTPCSFRHLMMDIGQLLPHGKKDSKLDTKSERGVINEVADLKVQRQGTGGGRSGVQGPGPGLG